MCGRTEINVELEKLGLITKTRTERIAERRGLINFPNLDLRPTQDMPVITNLDPEELQVFRWGLLPFWAKDKKESSRYINARSESIFEKPAWKPLINKKRCLVPVTAYFEWKEVAPKKKEKYRLSMKDSEVMYLAGMWNTWKSPEGEEIDTCTIITTASKGWMTEIHDRMPVIMEPGTERLWLNMELNPQELMKQLHNDYLQAEVV